MNEYGRLNDYAFCDFVDASVKYDNCVTKKVYDLDTFIYADAKVGDYVTEDVVNDAMDCLPPACYRSDCSQLGEAYSHEVDKRTGKWRTTFHTFKRVEGRIWEYCGLCFHCENVDYRLIK